MCEELSEIDLLDMANNKSAEVFVTKVAAAQRLLDAAIRMTFSDEDDLAIHSITAAAYRIIRDLTQKFPTSR
jgi:hypothetical protein